MTIRKRDADQTRADILVAAQNVFATRGYAAAGVREITALAGVNSSLAIRYFGSKEKLFEEALNGLLDVTVLTRPDRSNFGVQLVEAFVSEDGSRINPLELLVRSAGDPEAHTIAYRLLRERIHRPLAEWFGGEHGSAKSTQMLTLAVGFFTYRLLYPLDEWMGGLEPASRRWLEQSFQAIVDDAASQSQR
jgi:AcrR family transcriptional regulator